MKQTDAAAYKITKDAKATANADFNRTTKDTDVVAYKTRQDVEAWSFAATKNAEANLVKKLREVEGISAMADLYQSYNCRNRNDTRGGRHTLVDRYRYGSHPRPYGEWAAWSLRNLPQGDLEAGTCYG